MVFVRKSDKAEWLKACALKLARGRQHFSHAMDCASLGVEGNLNEIARRKLPLYLEQAAGHGKRLEFCARVLAALSMNGGRNRSVKLYSGRTPIGVSLGEVGHSHFHFAISGCPRGDYQSACPLASNRRPNRTFQVCDNIGNGPSVWPKRG